MVYIVNDGRKVISCGSRDHNLAGTSGNMGAGLLLGGVEACALQNHVNLQLAPGKVLSVCFLVDSDGLAVYGDIVLACHYGIGIFVLALRRVIL